MDSQQHQAGNRQTEHLKPWQFKPGQSGNPKGRTPGSSVKDRAQAMLRSMNDDEFEQFLAGIDKKTVWEMAEGKPRQDTDITTKGESLNPLLVQFLDGSSNGNTTGVQTPV